MKTKSLKNLITNFLISDISSRDDNNRMIMNVWNVEFPAIEHKTLGVVCVLLARKELTNYDTITRMSRKIQEENPSLRGMLYYAKRKKAQVIKENMGQLDKLL